MRVFLAAVVLIAVSLALLAQVHPFPGPGGAPNVTPMTGIVATGLVAYWDLNTAGYNAVTGKFTDFSGTGNHIWKGTDATTGLDPVTDANYTEFNADGQTCDMVTDSASLSITGDITIEVITNPTNSAGYPAIVGKGSGSEFVIGVDLARKIRLLRNGTASAYSTAGMTWDTWYSVAAVCTGTSVQFYSNAATNGTGTTGTAVDKTTSVAIARQGTSYYRGKVARVRIYNRALSGAEIAANYARDKVVLAGRGISLP